MDRELTSDSEETEESDASWIAWYCGLKGNEYLCEVDKGYIEDGFNLYGLRAIVPNYSESLKVILDVDPQYGCDSDTLTTASQLYGLIHARYILTTAGLNAMHEKYIQGDFGRCPIHFCGGRVIPAGLHADSRQSSIKAYCPKCGNIFDRPRSSESHDGDGGGSNELDGAVIGPTFPHLFFMTFTEEMPPSSSLTAIPLSQYVPKVFGFKVHHTSVAYGPHRFTRRNPDPQDIIVVDD
jgi:casein kinase II subunit beta